MWNISRQLPAMDNYNSLPAGLPRPEDDGAAAHLTGAQVPEISLAATTGETVWLSRLEGLTVVYAYPLTGKPGQELPQGWDLIPGARGCTPQSCGFRDLFSELTNAGARHVFGLSTQSQEYQQELAARLHLPFPLLSDEALELAQTLRLPVFDVDGNTLLRRLTMVIESGKINRVFYPVFPPDRSAQEVLDWLKSPHSPGS